MSKWRSLATSKTAECVCVTTACMFVYLCAFTLVSIGVSQCALSSLEPDLWIHFQFSHCVSFTMSMLCPLSSFLSLPSLHCSRIWQLWDYNETTVSQSQARSKAVTFIVCCVLSVTARPSSTHRFLLLLLLFYPSLGGWMNSSFSSFVIILLSIFVAFLTQFLPLSFPSSSLFFFFSVSLLSLIPYSLMCYPLLLFSFPPGIPHPTLMGCSSSMVKPFQLCSSLHFSSFQFSSFPPPSPGAWLCMYWMCCILSAGVCECSLCLCFNSFSSYSCLRIICVCTALLCASVFISTCVYSQVAQSIALEGVFISSQWIISMYARVLGRLSSLCPSCFLTSSLVHTFFPRCLCLPFPFHSHAVFDSLSQSVGSLGNSCVRRD